MNESCVIAYVNPGQVNSLFMQSVLDTMISDEQRAGRSRILRNGGVISMVSGPRIASARNNLVDTFLKHTTASWLLMVDSDMVFRPENLDKLMASAHPRDVPIIGGLCFGGGRSGAMFPTLYVLRPTTEENPDPVHVVEEYPDDALVKVDATGAAFLLMHRDTLEKIGAEFAGPSPWFAEGTVYKGIAFGEDWAFCMRAKHMEIPVHVHTGVKIGHIKPQILDEGSWLAYKQLKDEIGEEGIKAAYRQRIGASQ